MELTELTAISPVDGRYRNKCERLDEYFLNLRSYATACAWK